MSSSIAALLAIVLFGYAGANGLYMLISPSRWAAASWTAKGIYGNPDLSQMLTAGRTRRGVRITGFFALAVAAYAMLTLASFYSG